MSLIREYLYFLRHHKWWWMLPLLVALALLGLVAWSTARDSPFLYPVR